MNLYATIKADKLVNGQQIEVSKGQGGNKYLQILIVDEEQNNIAQLNVFNDVENLQILTTFVPLNCQRFEKQGNSKAIALETKTVRYCTAYPFGKITKGKRQKGECLVCKNGTRNCYEHNKIA